MHKLIRLFSILSLAVVFGAVSANAQTITKVDADIPFAFTVGNTGLAAGKYNIKVVSNTAGTATVRISQKDGSGSWTTLGLINGDVATGSAALVFDRYGDERVLRQIATSNNAVAISGSGRKVRYAKNSGSKPETVTVALN
jgi:hypothetical protein